MKAVEGDILFLLEIFLSSKLEEGSYGDGDGQLFYNTVLLNLRI